MNRSLPTPVTDPEFWDLPGFEPRVVKDNDWDRVWYSGDLLIRGILARDSKTGKWYTYNGTYWESGDHEARMISESLDRVEEAMRRAK